MEEFGLVVIPLVRGDCWSVGFEPYPSIKRLIVVWLSAYPSKCRGDCGWFDFVPIPLVRGDHCLAKCPFL